MNVTDKLPLQDFRVAPLGYGLVAYGIGTMALTTGLVRANQQADPMLSSLTVEIAAAGLAFSTLFGAKLIKNQQALYQRLEASIERTGYNDRIFALTTDEWCSRQTARIVCEAAGVLPQYEQLCDERQETAAYTYVPHI